MKLWKQYWLWIFLLVPATYLFLRPLLFRPELLQPILPDSILSGVRTMTANIVLEMGYAADGIHRNALIATAVVLFVFILIINLSFSLLRRRND